MRVPADRPSYHGAVRSSAIRRFNTVMLVGWAAFFAQPGAYDRNPFHGEALGHLAPSWIFATVASLVAILSLAVRWPRASAASLIISTGWWTFAGVATLIEDATVVVWLLYLGVAALIASEWVSLDAIRIERDDD